jgi:flagellar biosynthetic protein FliR
MDALLRAIDWREAALFGLVLTRLSGALLGAPVFGGTQVPMPVKAILLFLASAAIYPGVRTTLGEPPQDAATFAVLAGRELALGLGLGFAVRLVFAAEELAGQMISADMGLTLGSIIHPDLDQTTPPLSNLIHALAVLVFLGIDGHHVILRAVHESFATSPPSLSAPLGELAQGVVLLAGKMFVLAVQISAPIVAAVLMSNLGLAVVSRAAPMLNIFSASFGLTILVGLAVLSIAAPGILSSIGAAFRAVAGDLSALLARP